jgi:hypothetical protein
MEVFEEVKMIYLEDNSQKKSASGMGYDMGAYIKIDLKPSKRRKKFNTVLIPWDRILKVIAFD